MTDSNQRTFSTVQTAPPDPILGLTEAFRADTNSEKINLSVGVYQDESGNTPILDCVKAAEKRLLADETTKTYLGIHGLNEYAAQVVELLFGAESEPITSGRTAALQTPGGTGGLRVAADFLKSQFPHSTVWCSTPTWANHPNIFRNAGLAINNYAYLDGTGLVLDFDAMIASLEKIPAGDVACLHACCHNPTGIDLGPEQWAQVIEVVRQRQILPLLDFAYQGFDIGIEEDAGAIREFAAAGIDMIVCNSFSKNFGLYSERVGGVTFVTGDDATAASVFSQAKAIVRTNYSNPPRHGGAIVSTVLADPGLKAGWLLELKTMRDRICDLRQLLVKTMAEKTDKRDFAFIEQQNGMFSYSGLTRVQVDELRSKHSIYIVGSGRINIAGINTKNIEPLCTAIASVL